mgnify:CR=1 FL=1
MAECVCPGPCMEVICHQIHKVNTPVKYAIFHFYSISWLLQPWYFYFPVISDSWALSLLSPFENYSYPFLYFSSNQKLSVLCAGVDNLELCICWYILRSLIFIVISKGWSFEGVFLCRLIDNPNLHLTLVSYKPMIFNHISFLLLVSQRPAIVQSGCLSLPLDI